MTRQTLRLELELDSDDEVAELRGALLAARASQIGELRRRDARHGFGYGMESQRDAMRAEADQARRRAGLLDRLLRALEAASTATKG